jgi:hypothetical protein
MFHQINLRVADVASSTINGITKQRSLYMMWAETLGPIFTSMCNWPFVQVKLDDLINVFVNRMTKDHCHPTTQLIFSTVNNATVITGFTVGADNNSCPVPIPVTLPGGTVTSLQGATTEQIGSDPLTLWVTLSGQPITYTLTTPIPI